MSDYLQLVQTYFPYVAKGASITIQLTIVALLGSVALGLLTTFAKLANLRLLRIVASIYIELIRATPALLQLFIIYFGLTSFGLRLDPFTAASITLSLVGGAYAAEIFRAGIEAVDTGQFEAARSLGMSTPLAMRRIILPQAAVIVLPPFTNFVISMIKDTSLALTISVPEIMYRSYDASSQSYRSMAIYSMAAVLYLAICLPLSGFAKALEKRRASR
ncbi:amino acid ABC transporter permease [Aquamicrobium sp. NLF2-7]|jgi:polar amino acid transport system permease protein|uniref:Polar amino acid transport system permease protein n=1 Tax=Aquamicrobium lusatiense TaxID=89772 RepID=A0A7W9VTJ0_9HYPH|nr:MULTISPECIES: amino acid ABC transporter permease [Aquamicrobium]MBB6011839.1 polar amino acid transport system permease protein [Aquamicrobium lusatiense]MCG8272626.1 amino acid ABC transporter permease [Aquamicrobium sp. NLF2-7]MCK9552447.1 amino acid ABC transporter permease [Aquamicrobium sp.]